MQKTPIHRLQMGIAGLLTVATLVGCVRAEPSRKETATQPPASNTPTGVTLDAEGSQIPPNGEAAPHYPQSDLLLLPGLENQQLITETSYIRNDGVPVITESIGLESVLIVSPHSIAGLVNKAMELVNMPILEEDAQEAIGNVTLQLREGTDRPIRIRFYNADLVDAALPDESGASAPKEITSHDNVVNEIIIDVPVGENMNDFQLNATIARAVLLSLLTTNVTDNWVYEMRDANLTGLLVNSLAYAFAYNLTNSSYQDYSDNFAFRTTKESGFSSYITDPVNLGTYWAFQDLYPLVWIPPQE